MPTLSTHALTTLGRVRATLPDFYADSNNSEDVLIQLINDVTSLFESEVRRRLKSRTYRPSGAAAGEENMLLSGNRRVSPTIFHLPEWPVTAVTAITIKPADLDATQEEALTAGDWTVEPDTGRIILINGHTWSLGWNNLEVVWTAGYSSTDKEWPALEKACVDQVRHEFLKMKNPQDMVTSISDQGGSVSYFQGPLLNQVRMVLENTFRRWEVA